ncbi:hypothetical protein Baya_9294 [Bagarius yarrelli]|uniref:Uncharacterized protein n=1 Tax=Bagarius yarrelli TaxID=175774 RepID=A0A556U6J6_BAGYA|nr:hypothetical protein Baya_9294 [Bagarius yarrelli]
MYRSHKRCFRSLVSLLNNNKREPQWRSEKTDECADQSAGPESRRVQLPSARKVSICATHPHASGRKQRLNEDRARSIEESDTADIECQCIPLDLLGEFIHAVALFTPLLEDSCVCGESSVSAALAFKPLLRRKTRNKVKENKQLWEDHKELSFLSLKGDKAAPADESLSLRASERSMSSLLASEWYCYGYSSGLKRGNHWFDSVTRCSKDLPPTAMVCMEGP